MNTDFLPAKFLEEMRCLLGPEAADYLNSFKERPCQGLRANGLKISPDQLKNLLPWELSPVPWAEGGFYLKDPAVRPALHPAYSAGLYYLQEPSAMAPGAFLPAEPGQRVLDLCAAPGGKSTQLAARLKGQGILVSNDISPSRARGLLKNLEMAGAANICVTAEEPGKLADRGEGWFDRILVDAPCSGEGMFRREPEMVKDWLAKGPEFYAPIQREILTQAARMLRPGGLLLYSTCTFSQMEDEGAVEFLLKEASDFRLEPLDAEKIPGSMESRILPGTLRLFPHRLKGEGHFLALLRKEGAGEHPEKRADEWLPGKPWKEPGEIFDFLPSLKPTGERVRLIEDQLYLLPELMPAWKSLRFLRTGLHLGSLKKGRFEPSQALAMAINPEEYPWVLTLAMEDERVIRYLKGETISLKAGEAAGKGWILVCAGGFGLGWARGNGQNLMNKYYPGWRRQ